jgi:hypothetical protein
MQKALIALTATVPLALLGVWTAEANPLSNSLRPLSQNYLIEQIGCEGGPSPKDRCPYGYRISDHRGCVPCWQQRHGSRYRDWDYEPRRYGDDGGYEPRRYQEYNDRYSEPRRYRDY